MMNINWNKVKDEAQTVGCGLAMVIVIFLIFWLTLFTPIGLWIFLAIIVLLLSYALGRIMRKNL